MASPAIFVLLTDFGLQDPYVGQMKGVLLQGCPGCAILDLSHEVRPQSIVQGGFFLAASWPHLPPGSVCLGVVDPGVGTGRGLLLIKKQGRYLLVPDNGLAGQVLDLDGEHTLWSLAGQRALHPASSTFHGRDVFAPLAVRLIQQSGPGPEWRPLTQGAARGMNAVRPVCEGRKLKTTVLHIDRFGNCILNLGIDEWTGVISGHSQWRLLEPASCRVRLVQTYAHLSDDDVGILKGSQTMYELAMNQISCARRLNLEIGSRCVLEPVSGT